MGTARVTGRQAQAHWHFISCIETIASKMTFSMLLDNGLRNESFPSFVPISRMLFGNRKESENMSVIPIMHII